MTDPANDSSRSWPKFWKHSAPGSGGPGHACLNIFLAENASHSLSKTYGCRSLLLLCPIDPPNCSSRLSRLRLASLLFRLLVSLLGVFCVREIRKRRTCERRGGGVKRKTAWLIAVERDQRSRVLSSRLFRIFICSATCGI